MAKSTPIPKVIAENIEVATPKGMPTHPMIAKFTRTARVLGIDRAQVSRWCSGTEPVGSEMARRVVDLHDVLTRILRVYGYEAAAMWLVGSEPLLGGARPIDVMAMEGAAPVIRAIDGIMQGAYS